MKVRTILISLSIVGAICGLSLTALYALLSPAVYAAREAANR